VGSKLMSSVILLLTCNLQSVLAMYCFPGLQMDRMVQSNPQKTLLVIFSCAIVLTGWEWKWKFEESR
jgi:heme/copper-type cytochrome/quinol oxidase subunit 4